MIGVLILVGYFVILGAALYVIAGMDLSDGPYLTCPDDASEVDL